MGKRDDIGYILFKGDNQLQLKHKYLKYMLDATGQNTDDSLYENGNTIVTWDLLLMYLPDNYIVDIANDYNKEVFTVFTLKASDGPEGIGILTLGYELNNHKLRDDCIITYDFKLSKYVVEKLYLYMKENCELKIDE